MRRNRTLSQFSCVAAPVARAVQVLYIRVPKKRGGQERVHKVAAASSLCPVRTGILMIHDSGK
jgi:hypothetical protein